MRYFIAHLVPSDVKRYHERLVRSLHRTHKIRLPKRHSPPHITVKPPFECGLMGIVEVEKALRSYTRLHTAPRYTLSGFGKFGFKTIYLDAIKSPQAVSFVRGLVTYLNHEVPWLPRASMEGNKLHTSVARHLDRKTSSRVWRALKHLEPRFECTMDTVAVLKMVGSSWTVRTLLKVPRTKKLPLPE